MSWLEKTQEMFKSWLDSQQELWKGWTESADMPSAATWSKTLKIWENSFKNFVETQALWTRTWVRNMAAEFEVEGMDDFVQSTEDLTNTWVKAQHQLWSNWFEMVKNMDPNEMSDEVKAEATEIMQSWQNNLEKMVEAQRSWAEQWAKMFGQDQD
jgi:hypothetical protein